MPFWQELILLLAIALLMAVGIKALFLQAFYIPSGSMNDTLVFNDRILVQKVSYWGSASPRARRHRGVRRPGRLARRGGRAAGHQRAQQGAGD